MKFRSLLLPVLLQLFWLPFSSLASLGEAWEWTNPLPQGNSLHGITSNDGKIIAVGESGTIITSTDGEKWSHQTSGTNNTLNAITSDGTRFFAVGDNGTLLVSANTSEWTEKPTGSSAHLLGITAADNNLVIVGANGTILTSTDGETWSPQTSPVTENLNSVTFANNTYIAAGARGKILKSNDGLTWTTATSGTDDNLNKIAFLGGEEKTWIAVGDGGILIKSNDGETWSRPPQATILNLADITYFNEKFIAVGEIGITLQSTDGNTWNQQTSEQNSGLFATALLDSSLIATGVNGTLLKTGDATKWTPVSSGHNAFLVAVGHPDNRFIAVGTLGRLYTSADGSEWNQQFPATSAGLWDVAFGNGRYVIVGNTGTIRHSTDGETWTITTSGTNLHLSAITYGNGQFIAGGRNGIILSSSDDANSWTDVSAVDANDWIEDIIHAENQFIAVGANGRILTSSSPADGWSTQIAPVSTTLTGIAHGNGIYVTVGAGGTILSSSDATLWKTETSNTTENLNNIAFGNGIFVAVGNKGTILTSPNGTDWTTQRSGTKTDLWGIGATEGVFIATGDNGVILRSRETAPPVDGLLFADWVRQNGIPSGFRNIDDAPAGDGIPNLVKFALGLDPLKSERHNLPRLELISISGKNHLALNLTQATDIHGAKLALESSTDLINWNETSHNLENLGSISENLRQIRLIESLNIEEGQRRFLRLKVSVDDSPPADPEPAGYSSWVALHRIPAENAAPEAQLTGDGIPNLMKYALGLDPWQNADRSALPQTGTRKIDGKDHQTLTFNRSTTATGIRFVLEGSDDLHTWTDLTADLSIHRTIGPEHEEVSLTDTQPMTGSKRFIRLKVVIDADAGSIPPGTTGFDDWAALHNLAPADATPSASPAGDGLPNLLKYGMGIDPREFTNSSSLHTRTTVMVDGESHISLTFKRSTSAEGIEFFLEGSNDLTNWIELDSVLTVLGPADGGREEVSLTDSEPVSGSSKRFLRISIRQIP